MKHGNYNHYDRYNRDGHYKSGKHNNSNHYKSNNNSNHYKSNNHSNHYKSNNNSNHYKSNNHSNHYKSNNHSNQHNLNHYNSSYDRRDNSHKHNCENPVRKVLFSICCLLFSFAFSFLWLCKYFTFEYKLFAIIAAIAILVGAVIGCAVSFYKSHRRCLSVR